MKKLISLLVLLIIGLILWILDLRRRLHIATMRGDTYRDMSIRLDRQLSGMQHSGGES